MKFKAFQESKKFIKDLDDQDDNPTQGYIYLAKPDHSPYAYENLFIESVDCPRQGSAFYLCIERSEYTSDNLAELEKILFQFAMDEGYDEKQAN